MNLQFLYVHEDRMGYGRLGVKLAEALRRRGYDLNDTITNNPDDPASQLAVWVSAPSHAAGWWKGQHAAIFTMWEASRLPEAMRENLHEFDTVLVPSPHNLELFSRYHDNVRLVTLGVDTDEWAYRERQPADQEFRFMVGGTGKRKGTDLVYKAFQTLWGRDGSWGSGPTPKLIMKNPKGEDFYGPRVQMITGKLPAQEEIDLYGYAHCYVQPSRGEGFGLQPLQAIAQGCPTILTDAHGHGSYAHLGIPLTWDWGDSEYFIFGDAGKWWEPDFDDLVDKMRWVYDHYDTAVADAKRMSPVAHEKFSWDASAQHFVDAFDPNLFSSYDGPWDWKQPESKLFRVRVTSKKNMEIAGTRYAMEPDVDYWCPADVKRILFEGGSLDPECLDDADSGLTDAQLANVGLYQAKHAFCPACHQQLNTKVTIDEIYEQLGRR